MPELEARGEGISSPALATTGIDTTSADKCDTLRGKKAPQASTTSLSKSCFPQLLPAHTPLWTVAEPGPHLPAGHSISFPPSLGHIIPGADDFGAQTAF